MRLIIRSDANFKIGFGHIMRCLALAQYWHRHMGPVHFVCHKPLPEPIESRLNQEGFEIESLSVPPGSDEDAKQLIAFGHSVQANAIFIDGYHFNEAYQQVLSSSPFYVLVIDDYAHLDNYWADGLLNQNPGITAASYAGPIQQADLLLGPRFALLRQEIIAAEPKAALLDPVDHDTEVIQLLITLGGTQPEGLIPNVLDALVELSSDYPMTVKLLASDAELPTLPSWIQQTPYTDNMAALYRWANLAICGGGSTQWEMSFFGIPRLAIILAENQIGVTEYLDQKQCCINAGPHHKLTRQSIIDNLRCLFSNGALRDAMRKNNHSLVDGQGAKRVCEFIAARINNAQRN